MSSTVHGPLNQLFAIHRSLIEKKFSWRPPDLNAYAALLKSNGEVLWSARIILLAAGDRAYRGILPVGNSEPEKQTDQV